MGPSSKLISELEKIKKFSMSDLEAWSRFLRRLPCYSAGFTSNEDLCYDPNEGRVLDCENEDSENIFSIHLDIEPAVSGQYALLGVQFFLGNRAVIAKTSFNKELPAYLEKIKKRENIFGFEGTWEEVCFKLLRLGKIIGNQIPPLPATPQDN